MKKFFASLLLMAMLVSSAWAMDLWFTWTPNPTGEAVTSYVIEQANLPSSNFVAVVTAPGTTNVWAVRGLAPGGYLFRVYAVNALGRGTSSSALSYPTNGPSQVLQFQYYVPSTNAAAKPAVTR